MADRRMISPKYSMTVAFIVLALATAFGFVRVAQLSAEMERQSILRAEALCEKDNDVRKLLGTTLRSLFMDSNKEFDEALADIEERLTALESTVLAPADCAQVADDRREN